MSKDERGVLFRRLCLQILQSYLCEVVEIVAGKWKETGISAAAFETQMELAKKTIRSRIAILLNQGARTLELKDESAGMLRELDAALESELTQHCTAYREDTLLFRSDTQLEPVRDHKTQGVPKPSSWEDIEIQVLNTETVQLVVAGTKENRRYEGMGFQDGRGSGRPIKAWTILQVLAKASMEGKALDNSMLPGQQWRTVETRVKEIRRKLRDLFRIEGDPLPCTKGRGYRPAFKLTLSNTYEPGI